MPGASPTPSPPTFADVGALAALAARLPGVEAGTRYGPPAPRVRDEGFARTWEDGTTRVSGLRWLAPAAACGRG